MAKGILAVAPAKIGRQEAIDLGLNRYFTGKPCANGHICYRYLSRGCIACAAEQAMGRADRRRELSRGYRERHAAKEQARHALYSATNKEKISAKNAAWRSRNKDSPLASKAWREKNPERANELVRAWQAKNKEKMRAYSQNRRARKKSNGGTLSSDIVERLLAAQRRKCACCGKPLGKNFHLDHIIPLALGGPNADDNVQLLTRRCNAQKGAKHPVEFMQQRGFLL